MTEAMNNRNKRLNRKKICSLITSNGLTEDKESVLDNMKHDFFAHMSDRRCDRADRHRRTVAVMRKEFQSLLMQIPTDLQNLTIEEIVAKDGTIGFTEHSNGDKCLTVGINKTLISKATNDLSQEMATKRTESMRKPNLLKTTLTKTMSTQKTSKETNRSGIATRSALKTHTTRHVLTHEKQKTVSTVTDVTEEVKTEIVFPIGLSQLKPPRKPCSDEEVVTLCFSTAGTPLLMDRTAERIDK